MEEKIYPHLTVDSFDLIICVALAGGFITDNWLPAIFFIGLGALASYKK